MTECENGRPCPCGWHASLTDDLPSGDRPSRAVTSEGRWLEEKMRMSAPDPDVLTEADLVRAYEQMSKTPRPPEMFVVHPDDLEHLKSHGETADMGCVRCLQIWVNAQRVRYSW